MMTTKRRTMTTTRKIEVAMMVSSHKGRCMDLGEVFVFGAKKLRCYRRPRQSSDDK